jgi:hypothetical protein
MNSSRKKKIYFLIVILTIAAVIRFVPQFFFEKPKPGFGDEVRVARNRMDIVIETIEELKKRNGIYPDSIGPVLALFKREMNLDLTGLHPEYRVAPDHSSFKLSFDMTDDVPVHSSWSSEEKVWNITIPKSSE